MIIGTVFAISDALASSKHSHPINHDSYAIIKKSATTWVPHIPESNPLRNKSREELLSLVSSYVFTEHPISDIDLEPLSTLPTNFDPRFEKFSSCIHPVID